MNVKPRPPCGQPARYKAGDAYVEALNRDHQLFNVGDAPARLIAVFVSKEGTPPTVAAK
jgi:quercetin dioxygenase-like cupin family protein